MIVTETLRFVASNGAVYNVTMERILPTFPDGRADVFPSHLSEREDGILTATYPDGSRETFVGFDEIHCRFSSRTVNFVSDFEIEPYTA